MPVAPVFKLLVPVLVLAEHHHDDTLEGAKGGEEQEEAHLATVTSTYTGSRSTVLSLRAKHGHFELERATAAGLCRRLSLDVGGVGVNVHATRRGRRNIYTPAYSDFADGVTQALVCAQLVQRHSVELALVEVRHRTLALLLSERSSGVQRVLETVPAHGGGETLGDWQQDIEGTLKDQEEAHFLVVPAVTR